MSSAAPLPPWRWLLDNCQCQRCLHPITRERTVTLVDEWDVRPISVTTGDDRTITVDWGDEHVGVFPASMLTARTELTVVPTGLTTLPRINYEDLGTNEGMGRWLTTMLGEGAILVENTPNVSGEVIRLAERIGYARPTNFGTIFDVESRPDPNNSAYTAAGLDLHTDLPNWSNPPDFQFLHSLANEATGGDSMLADGVEVAAQLRVTDPKEFEILTTTPCRSGSTMTSTTFATRHPSSSSTTTTSRCRFDSTTGFATSILLPTSSSTMPT